MSDLLNNLERSYVCHVPCAVCDNQIPEPRWKYCSRQCALWGARQRLSAIQRAYTAEKREHHLALTFDFMHAMRYGLRTAAEWVEDAAAMGYTNCYGKPLTVVAMRQRAARWRRQHKQ